MLSYLVLDADATDEYGQVFKAGSAIFRVHFLDFVKEFKRAGSIYKLNNKQAFIYKDTVMFVGLDLHNQKSGMLLKSSDHADIILSIY